MLGARPRHSRRAVHVDLRVQGHLAATAFDSQGNRQAVAKRRLSVAKDAAAIEQNGARAHDVTGQKLDISDQHVMPKRAVDQGASVDASRKVEPIGQPRLAREATEDHVSMKARVLNSSPIKTINDEHSRPVG